MAKIICVIPSRLASKRFPNKSIYKILGKPLVEWVYLSARASFDEVVFAIEDESLESVISSFGGSVAYSKGNNGTERLCGLLDRYDADIWVNWQGDLAFLSRDGVRDLLSNLDSISTIKKSIGRLEAVSANVVKVVTNASGKALYFSRASIPHGEGEIYQHIGIYAYTREALKEISRLPPSILARSESLEQLAFLEGGMDIRVMPTNAEFASLDSLDGIDALEELIKSSY